MKRFFIALGVTILFAVGFTAAAGGAGRMYRICSTATTTVIRTVTSTINGPTTTVTQTVTTTTTAPSGNVLYRGDYESGDFSQWWLTQFGGAPSGCGGPCGPAQVGNTSATIVTSPVAQGTYAAKFTAAPCASGCPNDRAEVLASQAATGGYAGQSWYYSWWTYFPTTDTSFWSAGGGWNDITQFGSPQGVADMEYVNVNAADYPAPHLQLDSNTSGEHDLGALQTGHWYHFVVYANWETGVTGEFALWVDGTQKLDLHEPTLDSTGVSQWSQGFYTNATTPSVTVYQDGACRASSYAAASTC